MSAADVPITIFIDPRTGQPLDVVDDDANQRTFRVELAEHDMPQADPDWYLHPEEGPRW